MFGNLGDGLDMSKVTAQMGPTAAPLDQRTNTITMAPSAVATRAIGPAYNPADPGGGSSMSLPGCLTAAQVALIVNCAVNPGSPDCAALQASSGLPLCPGQTLPLPNCRDDQMQSGISYCDQYGPNGPDAGKNGVCWAAGKDPEWYQSMKALPACPGSSLEQAEKKNTLMWGGILLAIAVVGGGLYWYTKKK